MIPVTCFSREKVAVFGLGRSGLSTALALRAGGAEVVAWDDVKACRAQAAARGVALADLAAGGLAKAKYLVLSPGVPFTHPAPHPVVGLARSAGVEVVGDVELLARSAPEARFVGITGTNGKSTTTALLGHLMREAGRPVQVGGNLGPPALALDPFEGEGTYVLEMSSYQLDLTRSVTFDLALWLNLSPDHLDRHGGIEGYIAAKKRIFERQSAECAAIVGVDDRVSAEIGRTLRSAGRQRVIPISGTGAVSGGVFAIDGRLYDDIDGDAAPVADLTRIPTLPGVHNWQNAAAAYAAARVCGLAPAEAAGGLANYPGLPHRLEQVAVIGHVRYINDSKATNIAAAAQALACYQPIYWIAGGRAKDFDLNPILPLLPRIAHAYLIGEAAAPFAALLRGRVPVTISGELTAAVAEAGAAAAAAKGGGPVVLLSPACASFDQFTDFEARGEAFRTLVLARRGEADGGRGGPASAAGRA